jgi:hypothetical protein
MFSTCTISLRYMNKTEQKQQRKNIKVKMKNDSNSYKLHPTNNVSMLTSLLTLLGR